MSRRRVSFDQELAQTIGANIRLERRSKGYNLVTFGPMVGVTAQQMQKYETGVNRISADFIYQIAQILGVDVNRFYQGLAATEGQDTMSARRTDNLLAAYRKISDPKVKDQIYTLVKSLSDKD